MPANIAEGSKRLEHEEFTKLLKIAEGSLAETGYLLMFGWELGYLAERESKSSLAEADEIACLLNALRTKVQQAN